MAKSPEQMQSEALTVQLEQAKASKVFKKGGKRNSKQKSKKDKRKGSRSDPNKDSDKKATNDTWAWKEIAPKEGEPKKKTVKGKEYNFCKHHKKWCLHTKEECKIGQKLEEAARQEALDAKVDEEDHSDSEDSNTSEILTAFCTQSASE